MSGYLADTPRVTEEWCPMCRPDRDPLTELLEVRTCEGHREAPAGSEDGRVTDLRHLSGAGEADGHDCRAFQALIR